MSNDIITETHNGVDVQFNRITNHLTLTKDDKTHTLNPGDSFRFWPNDGRYMIYRHVGSGSVRIYPNDTSSEEIWVPYLKNTVYIQHKRGSDYSSPDLDSMCFNFDTINVIPMSTP
jgi:hypothetical protein